MSSRINHSLLLGARLLECVNLVITEEREAALLMTVLVALPGLSLGSGGGVGADGATPVTGRCCSSLLASSASRLSCSYRLWG